VESFACSICGNNEANVALLDGLLDVLAIDGCTRVAPEDAALAGAGVHGHRLIGEDLCQFGSNPLRRVIVLAENDATVLQPGLALRAMLCEEIRHGRQLRVTGFGA